MFHCVCVKFACFDARTQTPPSQSEPPSPSAYLNTSYDDFMTATPTQASLPSSGSSHHHQSSSSLLSHPSYPSPHSSQMQRASSRPNLTQHIEQLDALDLARSTYHELLDWMSELAFQAQSMSVSMNMTRERDKENAYLLQAEIRRVHAALVQQEKIVKGLQRAVSTRSSSSSSSSSSSRSSRSTPSTSSPLQ